MRYWACLQLNRLYESRSPRCCRMVLDGEVVSAIVVKPTHARCGWYALHPTKDNDDA